MTILKLEVHGESFLHMLNVLCDAILEDGMLRTIRINENEISTCPCKNGERLAARADLTFLEDLLPKIESDYPGIFMYYSPIQRVLESFKPPTDQ